VWTSGAKLCYTSQNLGEFWNTCTRPVESNGFGMAIPEADRRAGLIEERFTLLPDSELVHREWRRLLVAHAVRGVQVHDARLVAAMRVHEIRHVLTFNGRDFQRYNGIVVVHPEDIAGTR
jgi:predicted nucleic acid-binding protein